MLPNARFSSSRGDTFYMFSAMWELVRKLWSTVDTFLPLSVTRGRKFQGVNGIPEGVYQIGPLAVYPVNDHQGKGEPLLRGKA